MLAILNNFHSTNNTIEIVIDKEIRPVILELFLEKAPINVNKFLRYVDDNRFEDSHFYSTVHSQNQRKNDIKIEVIQSGLKSIEYLKLLYPIDHETTARTNPRTTNSEIFICNKGQPSLDFNGKRNPGQSLAAIGRFKSGIEMVRKI